jgi:protein-disulfide isomerase
MNQWASRTLCVLFLCMPALVHAQTPTATTQPAADQAQIVKNTEDFVRSLFAWGPEFKVTIGPLAPSLSADFYLAPVQVTVNDHTDKGKVYVSKDGKTFIQGEMFDMKANPFADNLAKIHVEGDPSTGPADAKVTIVEFSDFQCPHCREFFKTIQATETQYPQVRIVFKDFPLTQIHPWAETAALAARCAYMQKPSSFASMQALIFDNQDLISTENVWDKLADFAARSGVDADAMKACMSSPEAKAAIDSDRHDGEALNIDRTPTAYVNGRIVLGDAATLNQYLQYELAHAPK